MSASTVSSSSSSSALRNLPEEAPIAASFARTLRAFAEEQRVQSSRQRPSPATATPITQKRPLTTLGTLRQGPEKIAEKKAPQPAAAPAPEKKAAPAEKPSPARKPSRPQSSPMLSRAWNWLQKQSAFSAKKQLRVCETVSLGEKRFVAVVQIEGQKFLIGGGSSGVSLLAELDNDAALEIDSALDHEEVSQVLQPIACAGGRSR